MVWLDGAAVTMASGMRYFSLLSVSIALIIGALGPLQVLTSGIPIEMLSFGLLVSAVILNTVLMPKVGFNPIKAESDQTLEVELPIAGDHLSYDGPIALNAHRGRSMRRFRRGRPKDNRKDSASS
jgi:hypothetical protein